MLNKNVYKRFFLHSLRTALIFIAGFLTYELLKSLEDYWNKKHPDNEHLHFAQRKGLHFILIFIVDMLILISIALTFGIKL